MVINFVTLIVTLALLFQEKEPQELMYGNNLVLIILIRWKYHFVDQLKVEIILHLKIILKWDINWGKF